MRVAVLADIHGNLPALEAVLREVDAAGAEAVVLAGDMTVGPLQAETLDLLDSLGEKAIWVRGNCERAVVEVFDGRCAALPTTSIRRLSVCEPAPGPALPGLSRRTSCTVHRATQGTGDLLRLG
jgi:predicted phosphodiesterase